MHKYKVSVPLPHWYGHSGQAQRIATGHFNEPREIWYPVSMHPSTLMSSTIQAQGSPRLKGPFNEADGFHTHMHPSICLASLKPKAITPRLLNHLIVWYTMHKVGGNTRNPLNNEWFKVWDQGLNEFEALCTSLGSRLEMKLKPCALARLFLDYNKVLDEPGALVHGWYPWWCYTLNGSPCSLGHRALKH